LNIVPCVRITDCHLLPDWQTGELSAKIRFQNYAVGSTEESGVPEHQISGSLGIRIMRQVNGCTLVDQLAQIDLSQNDREIELQVTVPDYELWSPDMPQLYSAIITLTSQFGVSEKMIRFGFRDFRVVKGFFFLNGQRIFIKSAHSETALSDMYRAKAMGFNMLRFLAKMPPREVLDLCDELGLMIYSECMCSWAMWDYPAMPEHFRAYNDNMLLRDRNHPCIVIWGLFNEQLGPNAALYYPDRPAEKVFYEAVNYLPRLRELDETRVVLLSSGRWDGRPGIGSVANPGSCVWEYLWGDEAADYQECHTDKYEYHMDGYFKDTGDVHLYPTVPVSKKMQTMLRTIGQDTKPVFISEYGLGCQPDLIKIYLQALCDGESPDHPQMRNWKAFIDAFQAFWDEYGFGGVYPFPEDFLLDSIQRCARQRQLSFDLIRANPMVCGYSLTSFSSGQEGLKLGAHEDMSGMPSTIRECLQKLRWALFCDRCVYAEQPFEIEAVLCNEDVLAPGEYEACFKLFGAQGIAWEKHLKILLPDNGYGGLPPLAVSVLKEQVVLPAGEYTFAATLLYVASPAGGRVRFTVLKPQCHVPLSEAVAVWGLNLRTSKMLKEQFNSVTDFRRCSDVHLVVVGAPDESEKIQDNFEKLYKLASDGASVVFLNPCAFGEKQTASPHFSEWRDNSFLPFAVKGRRRYVRNWLYHVDNLFKRHPLFDGIGEKGIVDLELFADVYPEYFLCELKTPDSTICACAGLGMTYRLDTPELGLTLCEYRLGAGRLVLNSFRIAECLGEHPVADQLFYNILKIYG
ncbi:MAG TPA: hypothetical protein DD640_01765, partial [Clostridiales bacterium]|nr:hypothetical protein [Clostridiales bacterium]